MKKILLYLLLLLNINFLNAQAGKITTKLVHDAYFGFNFSEEWQFLTTDFYLYNEGSFINLVRTKKNKGEKVEHLTLTATLPNYFDSKGSNLVYPLYSYQIDSDRKNNITKLHYERNEKIRLLDDYPLAKTNGVVNADIDGFIVTDSNRNKFLRSISDQLINISSAPEPSFGIMNLLGELGKFFKQSFSKKQYTFRSSINLYNDTNFEKKPHSIKVYTFNSLNIRKLKEVQNKLNKYVQRIYDGNKSEELNIAKLSKELNIRGIPYFIVINYRSKYVPPAVLGDKIDSDFVKNYETRIMEDCNKKINTEKVCEQQKKLLDFYVAFLDFKKNVNLFSREYKKATIASKELNLFTVMSSYRTLLKILEENNAIYENNSSYQNDFSPRYRELISLANQYLEKYAELKDVKTFTLTLNQITKNKELVYESNETLENYLNILYLLKLPNIKKNTADYDEIVNSIDKIEEALQKNKYRLMLVPLVNGNVTEETIEQFHILTEQINISKCKVCEEKVRPTLEIFEDKIKRKNLRGKREELISIKKKSRRDLFSFIRKKDCYTSFIKSVNLNKKATETDIFIKSELDRIIILIDEFKEIVNEDISKLESSIKLLDYKSLLESKLENLKEEIQYCDTNYTESLNCK
ncbi:hypothetical protein [Aureivirga sp. CE67]|uniref:hypothetical protein n=1 Tax=Aureivirga sp. CE67 TaxID=1788983 RepID=UPI0018CBD06E|nr:hypothetical protein [Aureivirga sp. CE67]